MNETSGRGVRRVAPRSLPLRAALAGALTFASLLVPAGPPARAATNVFGPIELTPLPGYQLGYAYGIYGDWFVGNSVSDAGFRATIWDLSKGSTQPVDLGTMTGDVGSMAGTVNNSWVVGKSYAADWSSRVVAWDLLASPMQPMEIGTSAPGGDPGAISGNRVTGYGTDGSVVVWDIANPSAAPVALGQVPNQTFATPGRMSGDWAVGDINLPASNTLAVVWDLRSPTSPPAFLGSPSSTEVQVRAVSGNRAVGTYFLGNHHAAAWDLTAPASYVSLGVPAGWSTSWAFGVSGARAVGAGVGTDWAYRPLAWDLAAPSTAIILPGGSGIARVADGTWAVGALYQVPWPRAVAWNLADLAAGPVELPPLKGDSGADAMAMSGSWVTGTSYPSGKQVVWRIGGLAGPKISAISTATPAAPAMAGSVSSTSRTKLGASGPVGSIVTIDGSGFAGTTSVDFKGAYGIFSVLSDERITVIVPPGARSGKLSVTTSRGKATSPITFTVTP